MPFANPDDPTLPRDRSPDVDPAAGPDWQRVDALFGVAIGLSAAEREDYLARNCDDPALLAEVLSLLEADVAGEHFLAAPLVGRSASIGGDPTPGSATLVADDRDPSLFDSELRRGQEVGSYEILGLLGEGGMGRVYRARRSDGHFDRTVAIKVIRAGLDGEAIVTCFLRERQILADLDHPGIARMLDGGATADGRPFLVMEHIEGRPLLEYCQGNGLDIEARLRLFLLVCDAVQYAHRRLVVHRDLKPGNVLVDTEGEPRLLDFGTAKLLDDAHAEGAQSAWDPDSATSREWCSPRYASPEQLSGESVSTATDIYGLGGVLYALLTGRGPHRFDHREPLAMIRAVIEDPIELPSRAVLDPKSELRGEAGTRSRLAKRLEGDLDTVVATAMAKEPERRYATAEALAEDIRRHLEHRPIRARRPTFGYRADRFLRRHWRAVTAAAAIVAVALLGAAAYVEQARATATARDRAEQVAGVLAEMFEDFDPDQSPGQREDIRQRLARNALRIDGAATDPEVRASLLHTLGVAYGKLGDYADAERALSEAVELRRQELGNDHLSTASSLRALGGVVRSGGDFERSHGLHLEAAEIRQRLLPEDDPRVAESWLDRAEVAVLRDELDRAAELAERAVDLLDGQVDENDLRLADARLDLGIYVMSIGDLDRGEALMGQALEAQIHHHGPDHSEVAKVRRELAIAAVRRGDTREARRQLEAARHTYEQVLGLDHPRSVEAAQELSIVYLQLSVCAEAREMIGKSLTHGPGQLGEQHPDMGRAFFYQGVIRYHCGPRSEAREPIEKAIRIYEKTVGAGSHRTAAALVYLATVQRSEGDFDGAEASLLRAQEIRRQFYGKKHRAEAETLRELAYLARDRERMEEARDLLVRALELMRERTSSTHPEALRMELELAYLDHLEGRHEEAREEVGEIRERIVALHGTGNRSWIYANWVEARIDEALEPPTS